MNNGVRHPDEYDEIPQWIKDQLEAYAQKGELPHSDFLRSLIKNQFVETVSKADLSNQRRLVVYARYLYNKMPRGSWGSTECVQDWVAHHGLEGLSEPQQDESGNPEV